MISNDILTGTRLSGEWVTYGEAIAWAQTRDTDCAGIAAGECGISLVVCINVWAAEQGEGSCWLSYDDARDELLRRLRKGMVQARGRDLSKPASNREILLASEWADHSFQERGAEIVAGPIHRDVHRGWTDLLFDADQVLTAFPRTCLTLVEHRDADREELSRQYDPMSETRWTAPMVLAWIATRQLTDVLRVSDDYREDLGEPPADIEALAPIAVEAVLEAWRDLRRKAEAGALSAQGVYEASGEGVTLSAALWRGMKPGRGKAGFVCVSPAAAGYCHVTFSAAEVRDLWPGSSGDAASSLDAQEVPAAVAVSTAELRRRIGVMLDAHLHDPANPFPRQAHIDALQKAEFSAVGRERAREIRLEVCLERGLSRSEAVANGRPKGK